MLAAGQVSAGAARLPCHNFVSKTTKFSYTEQEAPVQAPPVLNYDASIYDGLGEQPSLLAFCAYAHPPPPPPLQSHKSNVL